MAVPSSVSSDSNFALLLEFFNLDERFRNILQEGLQKFLWNGSATKNHPSAKDNIKLAGSAIEGASLARLFQKSSEFTSGLNQEIEVDIEYAVLKLPESKQSLVRDIDPAEQGYVEIKFQQDCLQDVQQTGWNIDEDYFNEIYPNIVSPKGYLQPFKIKTVAQKKVTLHRDHKQGLRLLTAAIFNTKKKNVEVKAHANEITKSSVASEYFFEVQGERKLKVSFDTVVLIELSWQSQIAKDWLSRPKNWPTNAVCQQILGLRSVVIAKPSRKNKLDLDTTEMRYAFSQAERELVKMRSRQQNFVYMVFKIMFVKWIKPIDTEKISSFFAKTTMFWIAEEFGPENPIWDVVDSKCLVNPLQKLFSWLLEGFRRDSVPYYFNEKSNIIGEMSYATKHLVIAKIEEILKNVRQFLPSDIHQEFAFANDILYWTENFERILTIMKNKDYREALKTLPKELIVDIAAYFAEEGLEIIREKIEKELERFTDRAEKEIDRSLKKVDKEIHRFKDSAEKEVDRSSKKVEKEIHRVKESVGKEVERSSKKIAGKIKRFGRK